MLKAPMTPSQMISGTGNIIKSFVRVRDVSGSVVCLHMGGRNYLYRSIIQVNTVNFALMSEEDQDALIEGFKGFLNGLSYPLQILIRNMPYNLNRYLNDVESIQGDLRDLAQDHSQFVRQLASKRALVKRFFYIVVPADQHVVRSRAEGMINAQTQLKLRADELIRQLERLGLTGRRLDDAEIISLYHSLFLTQDEKELPITQGLIDGAHSMMSSSLEHQRMGTNYTVDPTAFSEEEIQDLIDDDQPEAKTKSKDKKQKSAKEVEQARRNAAREKQQAIRMFGSVAEMIAPASIEMFPWYMRINGEVSHEFVRTLALINYPRSAFPGWLEAIIQVDEPLVDFSIHIETLAPEQVTARLGKKSLEFRGSVLAAHRQGKVPDPTQTIALRDIETLRDNLARGDERIFNISVFAQVRAKSRQELSERNNRVLSAFRTLDFRALPAHWQHNAGFLSCLPEADNQLGRQRLFGTASASTFFPFTGSDISMETGVLFGVHPSGGMIILNPFNNKELENANLVVFAKSGAGKSFFLKTVSSRLLNSCNVYVVDPEAEYNNLCQSVRGQYVRLSSDSLQLNPFDLYGRRVMTEEDQQNDEGNFFREKLLNLVTLFELLLSDEGVLSQKEKAFLYRCLVKTYENRGISMDLRTHSRQPPNMQEFYFVLSSGLRGDRRFNVGEDVFGLSDRLERYIHLFPVKTQVELDNRFVDFNIRELNDTLKPIGLYLITEFLWTKMRQARVGVGDTRNSIVLIDEAWLLMQFPQGAKFLAEFARRIRKYGGGLWCTTQNSDDFLSSEEGRTILAMSTMKFLMKQDSSTIESVMDTFRLSPGQRNFLLSARRGEGLFATKNWTPMEVVASPLEAEMANTTLRTHLANNTSNAANTAAVPSVQGPATVNLNTLSLEEQNSNGNGNGNGSSRKPPTTTTRTVRAPTTPNAGE